MVEMEEKELLLASLKGYLEELRDSGLEELALGQESRAAAVSDPGPTGALADRLTGTGNPRARLLFLLTGTGFAGPAGELLAKVIQAMGFAPEDVFLLSYVPESSEAAAPSRSSLLSRIALVAPEVVVALGEPAAKLLLASREPVDRLRGRFLDLEGTQVMVTLHPEQLLADPALKREVWNEMQQVMGRLKA